MIRDILILRGCAKMNRLYCWPCLLFSSEKNTWTKEGVHDLNSFRVLKRCHVVSHVHVSAVADIIQFGKSTTEFGLGTLKIELTSIMTQ